ncbi:nucleotidyltransferase family protein [Limnoglobus roseus]|uniref:Molybdenum cofactor guanylyltransferase n=1 Tax=Limnoglobus roseus TaxID=2598579 RepID=A0A5C1ANT8_9BACT|nr:nucleotidyltransferase family protein [Limnoglobus roseus]QEL20660.1 molybdenum cofactor guanylyltransferase [Limnoglobus roseus]
MSVAGVVLAAGGSTRMGRPKQLLSVRGTSLVRHAVAAARDGGCEPVVVVLGANADAVGAELADLVVRTVRNGVWQDGPGTSVKAGVGAVGEADAVVILLCDQPFVDAAHVRRLVEEHHATGRPIVASAYSDAVGVPALFARTCFADLLALEPAGGAKLLLARNRDRVAVVPFPAGGVDLDTPADYERFLARG